VFQNSSVAWGDYDNDGDLDILLTGYSGSAAVSKIYKNNGDGTFTEQTSISLAGVQYSSVAWGDYDNDRDLDILLTGSLSNGNPVSKIYKNNGNGTFTEQTSISLTGVQNSSVAWGDYDNDGDLDILLTGHNGYCWSLQNL
jgi:predicted nucleotidyltransferase